MLEIGSQDAKHTTATTVATACPVVQNHWTFPASCATPTKDYKAQSDGDFGGIPSTEASLANIFFSGRVPGKAAYLV